MPSAFQEFSSTFRTFVEKYPKHPLGDEIRRVLIRNRFPREEWLKAQTRRMRDLIEPLWMNPPEVTGNSGAQEGFEDLPAA
jgi:hypothetical protein